MNSKILEGLLGKSKPQPGTFKANHSPEKRRALGLRLRNMHSDRIPVIVEVPPHRDNQEIALNKTKFLVPPEMTAGKMMFEIRKQLKTPLSSEKALFIFTDNSSLAPVSMTMEELYQKYHNQEDSLLYLYLCSESTFGH